MAIDLDNINHKIEDETQDIILLNSLSDKYKHVKLVLCMENTL